MISVIQQHMDAVEQIQADLEARIRKALGDITPEDILTRADELPAEIAQELRDWIEANLVSNLADEAKKFLEEIDEETVPLDDEQTKHVIGVMLDSYIGSVTIAATAALADIRNRAQLQQDLGRSEAAILSDVAGETTYTGTRLKAFSNTLVKLTDEFVNSASGAVVIESATTEEWVWVDVHDGRECADCQTRHGMVASLNDFVEMGLPRTGWSRCGGNCRCILVPAAAYQAAGNPGPVVRPRRK